MQRLRKACAYICRECLEHGVRDRLIGWIERQCAKEGRGSKREEDTERERRVKERQC